MSLLSNPTYETTVYNGGNTYNQVISQIDSSGITFTSNITQVYNIKIPVVITNGEVYTFILKENSTNLALYSTTGSGSLEYLDFSLNNISLTSGNYLTILANGRDLSHVTFNGTSSSTTLYAEIFYYPISLSSTSINENNSIGDVVGTIGFNVIGDSNTYNYEILKSVDNSTSLNFEESGNNLQALQVFDYETTSSYTIKIRAVESITGDYYQKQYTIDINNLPELLDNPTYETTSYNGLVKFDNPNYLDSQQFPFTSDLDLIYEVSIPILLTNGVTKTLVLYDDNNIQLSSVEITGTGGAQNLIFSLSNSSLSQNGYIKILSSDNFTGMSFYGTQSQEKLYAKFYYYPISLSNYAIYENNSVNDVIGTLSSNIIGDTNLYIYSALDPITGNSSAVFNTSNTNFRASQTFNYEVTSSFQVKIRATILGSGDWYEQVVTIEIYDVFQISWTQAFFPEESSIGTNIGYFTMSDAGPNNNTKTYTGTFKKLYKFNQASLFGNLNLSAYDLIIDVDDPVNYPGNISDYFYFEQDPVSNKIINLKSSRVFDFDSELRYTLVVSFYDGVYTNEDDPEYTTIYISAVNESFTLSLDVNNINENNNIDDLIGTITMSSEDFSWTGDDGSMYIKELYYYDQNTSTIGDQILNISDYFAVNDISVYQTDPTYANPNVVQFELLAKKSFDYETQTSYLVRIYAYDDVDYPLVPHNLTQDFIIYINNVYETPVNLTFGDGSTSMVLSGHTTSGTNINTFDVIEDASVTVSYSLVSGAGDTDNGSFLIVGNNLQLNTTLNYNTKKFYNIRVRVTDSPNGNWIEETFYIDIQDIGNLRFAYGGTSIGIPENSITNSTIGNLITNNNTGTSVVSYNLITHPSNATLSEDNSRFQLVNNQLQIKDPSTLDYESKITYYIYVEASVSEVDQPDGIAYSTTKSLTIILSNVYEGVSNLIFTNTTTTVNKFENDVDLYVGTFSLTVDAWNPDPSTTLTYSLPVNGLYDNDKFNIVDDKLYLNSSGDYETQQSYSVLVDVDEDFTYSSINYTSSTSTVFTINITNVIETPYNLRFDTDLNYVTVPEYTSLNTEIGTVIATLDDTCVSVTYYLPSGITDNDNFILSTDKILLNTSLDRETKSSYSLTLYAIDNTNNNTSTNYIFTVYVGNVYDPITNLKLNGSTSITVSESTLVETNLGTLTVVEDAESSIVYSLVDSATFSDNNSFQIVSNKLQFNSGATVDYETKSSFSIRVRATDNVGIANGYYIEETFTINLSNVYEGLSNLLLAGGTTIEIPENVNTQINIANITVFNDTPYSVSFDFAVGTGDSDNSYFQIVNGYLQVKSTTVFNYYDKSVYNIRLKAETSGLEYTLEQEFVINILQIAELLLDNTNIDENNSINDVIGTLTLTIIDPLIPRTFTVENVKINNIAVSNPSNYFGISGSNLIAKREFNYEVTTTYTIRIRCFDGTDNYERTFTIDINDVNDLPSEIVITNNNIDENTPGNTLIGSLSLIDEDLPNSNVENYSILSVKVGSTILSNPTNYFNLIDNKLYTSKSFDYEVATSYKVNIQMTNPAVTLTKEFIIYINEINEPPTNIYLSNNIITEKEPINTLIGTLSTEDQDIGNGINYKYTYSVVSVRLSNYSLVSNPLNYFNIKNNKLISKKIFDYKIDTKYYITLNVNDGLNNFSKEFEIEIEKLYIKQSNLPQRFRPCITYMIIRYNNIRYKVSLLVQSTSNVNKIYISLHDVHPFLKTKTVSLEIINRVKNIFSSMEDNYSLVRLNKYVSSNGKFTIGFSDDEEKHYMRILFSSGSALDYINGILNNSKRLPLLSLLQKNYVFYYDSINFYNYIDNKDNTNFNSFFNSYKIDTNSILGDKCSLLFNNNNEIDIDKISELKNLNDTKLSNVDNFNLEVLPLNINNKKRYLYTVNDNIESEINIILKIAGSYNSESNIYNISYGDKSYEISLSNFDVILYNYKNGKIGSMSFSKTGLYFYRNIKKSDYSINLRDLQNGRFTFLIKIKDQAMPVILNSENLPLSIPLKKSNTINTTGSVILERVNNKFVINSAIDNIILKLDNNDIYDIQNNIVNSLFVVDSVINIFLSFNYNKRDEFINVMNIGSNEFLEMDSVIIPFNYLLKYLPTYQDKYLKTSSNRLQTAKITMVINNSQIKEYILDLKNYNIGLERKSLFGKELLVISQEQLSKDFKITEENLSNNDYLIIKTSETVLKVENKILDYYYKVNFNKSSESIGYGFENNTYINVLKKGKSDVYTYIYNYNVYYTKDLIINNVFSALDSNYNLNSDQTIRFEFYKYQSKKAYDDSIELNQQVIEYETVGSNDFEKRIDNIISAEIQKIEDNLIILDDIIEVETPETIKSQERIETLNNLLSEMRAFGFFTETSQLNINVSALEKVNKSDIKFLSAVSDSSGEETSILGDNIESLAESNILGTKANKINIKSRNIKGEEITLTILQNDNNVVMKLNNYIKQGTNLATGSLVINLVTTHKIGNYNLDKNILPKEEINNYNYNEYAIRLWSVTQFRAVALDIRFLDESIEKKENNKILLPVDLVDGVYQILIYSDVYSNILKSGSDYSITISQDGKEDRKFILPFYVRGIDFTLGEDYINEELNVSFEKELIISSYLRFLLVVYGNLTDVTEYLKVESGGVYNDISKVDFSKITIDDPVYIYLNDNVITILDESYDLKMLYDRYYYVGYKEGVIAMRGIAYGSSGIVEITWYGPGTVPCVTKDSYILTPNGERCITDLREGDLVRTENGENVPIVKKMVRKVNRKSKMPFIIPKDHYGENIPNRDVYISPNHAYYLKQKSGEYIWKYPKHQKELRQTEWETVTYYNLKLPDYHKHQFICNGLAMESWNDDDKNIKPYTWVQKGNNIYKVF